MSVFSALLNNGPLLVGPLADRGSFDQYGTYRPGQVVVDGGVTYLNIAAIGAAPELEDTFDRRDQQGWGQSSHGEVWQTSDSWAHDAPAVVSTGRGVLMAPGGSRADGQLLGPASDRGDAELLTRLGLSVPVSGDTLNLLVGLSGTEDAISLAMAHIAVSDDGSSTVLLSTTTPGFEDADTAAEAGPTVVDGATYWLRLRRVGPVYSATLWTAGTVEPTSPSVTTTAGHAQPAGHPFLSASSPAASAGLTVAYVSVRSLTAADAPAGDADHWVALADALQVPQPL